MEEKEKFCVDCRWYHFAEGNHRQMQHLCMRQVETRHDIVTGFPNTYGHRSCNDERGTGNDLVCGANAQWFEPKPDKPKSWWERLIHHLAQRLGT
jgi:hypothetical protein